LHKETCYATTLDKEGEVVDRREFKNEREEWERDTQRFKGSNRGMFLLVSSV